jgi:hypothetical protein
VVPSSNRGCYVCSSCRRFLPVLLARTSKCFTWNNKIDVLIVILR